MVIAADVHVGDVLVTRSYCQCPPGGPIASASPAEMLSPLSALPLVAPLTPFLLAGVISAAGYHLAPHGLSTAVAQQHSAFPSTTFGGQSGNCSDVAKADLHASEDGGPAD